MTAFQPLEVDLYVYRTYLAIPLSPKLPPQMSCKGVLELNSCLKEELSLFQRIFSAAKFRVIMIVNIDEGHIVKIDG